MSRETEALGTSNSTLQWRHNGRVNDSNHQPHDCLLNRSFGRISKKTRKLRVTGPCAGNSPGTGEFPAQMASNAENVPIWWRHHKNSKLPITAHLGGEAPMTGGSPEGGRDTVIVPMTWLVDAKHMSSEWCPMKHNKSIASEVRFTRPLREETTADRCDHDDVIKWKYFPLYWPFVRGILRSPVDLPRRNQWRGDWCFVCLRLNKRLSEQLRSRWNETSWRSLWLHCNGRTSYACIPECRIW